MDKMRMESIDMTAQNIEKIGALFPNCITETKGADGKPKKAINFDLLRQILSGDVIEGDEAYEFTWVGKKAAIVEANKPIRKTLRPVMKDETVPTGADSDGNPYCSTAGVNWENTENLYIEGDNLEVLKLLQESYLGKVKMIYIDPPYNTGNDFIYRDDFKQSAVDYDEDSGVYDEDGNRMFKNTDSNGRFHSDWCSMIYSRLMLARNLLADDGFIFISIGEEEVENLYIVCDEVFGKSLHLGTFIWKRRQMVDSRSKTGVSEDHEYLICFAKQPEKRIRGQETDMSKYSNPDNDPRGDWMSADMTGLATASQRPNLHYDLVDPLTGVTYKCPPTGWRYERKRIQQLIENNEVLFPAKEDGRPRRKKFARDLQSNYAGMSTVLNTVFNTQATRELKAIFDGEDYFDFPKPVDYIKLIVEQGATKDGIVLDFFSGSATTAHAVMQLNAEDNGHRKFIMVQLPEKTDEKSEAYKAGYTNICEIGKERIRRAAKKIAEEHPDVKFDGGFRVLKLDDTNMKDVYYAPADYEQNVLDLLESNIKEDRTDLDLLFGCLLEWGLPLSLPYSSENIEGCTVHNYNDGDLIACFDESIPDSVIKTIAKRQPLRAVFRDSSFQSSPAKINVTQIFKELAPDTSVKVL